MLESSWPQRHIVVSKAGLQGCSLRELVKSGLVTLLTREREEKAWECNKTFHFSLSSHHFAWIVLFQILSSHPTLNLPRFFLSISLSSSLLHPYALSLSINAKCLNGFREFKDGQLWARQKGETKGWDTQISVYFCALCFLWQGRELLAS